MRWCTLLAAHLICHLVLGDKSDIYQPETYQGYSTGQVGQRFQDHFDKIIPADEREKLRVLIIGCGGGGDFADQMYKDGFFHIHSIDEGRVNVEAQLDRFTEMNFPDTITVEEGDFYEHGEANSYDIIIDKGALEMEPGGHERYLPIAHRLLKEDGLFIFIGPFAPKNDKTNGWYLGPDAPSSWLEDPATWRTEHVAAVANHAWTLEPEHNHPPDFYIYFLRRKIAPEEF